jgi:hypothetical protein
MVFFLWMELGVSWVKVTSAKNRFFYTFAHTAFILNIVTDKNLSRGHLCLTNTFLYYFFLYFFSFFLFYYFFGLLLLLFIIFCQFSTSGSKRRECIYRNLNLKREHRYHSTHDNMARAL